MVPRALPPGPLPTTAIGDSVVAHEPSHRPRQARPDARSPRHHHQRRRRLCHGVFASARFAGQPGGGDQPPGRPSAQPAAGRPAHAARRPAADADGQSPAAADADGQPATAADADGQPAAAHTAPTTLALTALRGVVAAHGFRRVGTRSPDQQGESGDHVGYQRERPRPVIGDGHAQGRRATTSVRGRAADSPAPSKPPYPRSTSKPAARSIIRISVYA